MVRPRLVEEGIPVGTAAVTDETDDHHMVDDMDHLPVSRPKTTANNSISSLQSACGGRQLLPRGKKHATRIVIGGDSALSNEDHVFLNDTHLQGPQHDAAIASSSWGHFNQHNQLPAHQNLYHNQGQGGSGGGHDHVPLHHQHHHFNTQQYHNHINPSVYPYPSGPPVHGTHIQIGKTIPAENYSNFERIPTALTHSSLVADPMALSQNHLHQQYSNTQLASTYPHRHPAGPPAVRTHIEIGADTRPTERMEGVEDHSIKSPLVVFDGANIAYAYAQAMQGPSLIAHSNSKLQPDARGIVVAFEYFHSAGLRVSIVLPQSYFRNKQQLHQQQTDSTLEILKTVKDYIVAAPPTDDDDAYALTIAQRENRRVYHHQSSSGGSSSSHGFVLSNDLFRDAAARDETGQLQEWLTVGFADGTGPGRLSYAFCDMGSLDDYGDRQLDFVPNPRHPLVVYIESNTLRS